MSTDVLEWIRQQLDPPTLVRVEPILNMARQTWGGDTVYIPRRSMEQRQIVSRRTVQRRQARTG